MTFQSRNITINIKAFFRFVWLGLLLSCISLKPLAQESIITTVIPDKFSVNDKCIASKDPSASIKAGDLRCEMSLDFKAPLLTGSTQVESASLFVKGTMYSSTDFYIAMKGADYCITRSFPESQNDKQKTFIWKIESKAIKQCNSVSGNNLSDLEKLIKSDFSLDVFREKRGRSPSWAGFDKDPNDKPRLVVKYRNHNLDKLASEQGNVLTHSPKTFLDVWPGKLEKMDITSIYSYTPVFDKTSLYLINEEQSLEAWSLTSGDKIWSASLKQQKPGQHLLINHSLGRIYVLGREKILVYSAQTGEEITNGFSLELKPNPEQMPVVGKDGSIYYSEKGVVYGLNPSLQTLWKVGEVSETTISTPTLSPNGQFLYVAVKDKGENLKLWAIDSRTGEKFSAELVGTNITELTGKLNSPVVIPYQDGVDKVYLATSFDKDNQIALFNMMPNYSAEKTWQLVKKTCSSPDKHCEWDKLSGQFSQPVVSSVSDNKDKYLYSVQLVGTQLQLIKIASISGKVEKVAGNLASSSQGLVDLDKTKLLVDTQGNILLRSGNKLTVYSPQNKQIFNTKLTSLMQNNRLGFGLDGGLYSVPASNENKRSLSIYVPEYDLSEISATELNAPSRLSLKGQIGSQTKSIKAGGPIYIKAGTQFINSNSVTILPGHLE